MSKSRIVVVIGGSPAIHQLGDIGREEDDLFVCHEEDGVMVGNWLEGLGFINVRVAKEHTRKLTHAEADRLQGGRLVINEHGPVSDPYQVDPEWVEDGWTPRT